MPWQKLWSSPSDVKASDSQQSKSLSDQAISIASEAREKAQHVFHDQDSPGPGPGTLQSFTQPQTILATVVLTTACLGLFRVYKKYLRRIPEATNIHPSFFRRRSILGEVTSVGDGDNFRIYHTPGGRLAGWGWFPGRSVPTDKKELKNQTIHVRMAGIDAPELAHFGRPAQPHSAEALEWLTNYVLGRRVRAYVYKQDQYSRVVATAYVWRGFLRRDIGLQMLRAGLATVYEAKSGAEFGEGLEQKYRKAEWWAKTKRKGMWASSEKDFESPREYKSRYSSGGST